MNLRTMIKRPSAFVPVAMSFAALAIVLVHIIMSGAAREADEGTAAHLWQLLMAAQIPIIAFFAILFKQQELTREMTRREFSERYAGQALGVLWGFLHPVAVVFVYIFVFSFVFQARVDSDAGNGVD